jgi:hypothetical protein
MATRCRGSGARPARISLSLSGVLALVYSVGDEPQLPEETVLAAEVQAGSPRLAAKAFVARRVGRRLERSFAMFAVWMSEPRTAWPWVAYRAGRSMLVTGGQAPACEMLVTRKPWRS